MNNCAPLSIKSIITTNLYYNDNRTAANKNLQKHKFCRNPITSITWWVTRPSWLTALVRDSRVRPGRMRKQFKTRKAALALARENLVEQVFFFAAPTSTKIQKNQRGQTRKKTPQWRHAYVFRVSKSYCCCLIFLSTMGETAKEESPKSVDSKRSWFILAIAFLSLFGVGGLQMSFGTILAHLVKQFDESKSKTGKMIKWNWELSWSK